MLHFTFQNMRAFYGPWLRGLGLKRCSRKKGTTLHSTVIDKIIRSCILTAVIIKQENPRSPYHAMCTILGNTFSSVQNSHENLISEITG